MRNITRDKKIQASSLKEIRNGLRDEAERLGEMGLKGADKISTQAYLLNWIVCYVLDKPPEERLRIAQEGKAILDAHRASKEAFPLGSAPIATEPDWISGKSATGLPGYVAEKGGKPKRVNRAIKNRH